MQPRDYRPLAGHRRYAQRGERVAGYIPIHNVQFACQSVVRLKADLPVL